MTMPPDAEHDLARLRQEYRLAALDESHLASDPLEQFHRWLHEARKAEIREANAMSVASVGADGRPSLRILLLKGLENGGFTFFTNYESRKGDEFAANPWAALTFFWAPLERQVRIEGRIERVSADESDAYFRLRPTGARLGAWASPQSRPIASRSVIEENLAAVREQHGEDPPRPPHWGGYRVIPERIEFWQGRENRLHDRLLFQREGDGPWSVERLAP